MLRVPRSITIVCVPFHTQFGIGNLYLTARGELLLLTNQVDVAKQRWPSVTEVTIIIADSAIITTPCIQYRVIRFALLSEGRGSNFIVIITVWRLFKIPGL